MKENPEEQNEIRQYLLGRLDDEAKMRQIEEKILLDDDYAEKLSVAENELIEEHLSGNLSRDEQKAFTEIFLAAPQRKKHLRMVENLHKYAAQSQNVREFPKEKKALLNWRDWFAMPVVRAAFAVLVVCVIGFAVWRAGFYESDVDKGLAQLKIAYRGQRPLEPRLTTDFDYAPYIITRGNREQEQQDAAVDETARIRAQSLLGEAAENSSDARARHALGLLYLAEKKFDAALKEFNLALKNAPNDARIYSDIGALYLEKAGIAYAQQQQREEFFVNADSALRNLNRALEIDDSLREALFNKALLLEKMPMAENQAAEAWLKYLEKDASSPWAAEAQKRLEQLKERIPPSKENSQVREDFLDAFRRGDNRRAWEIVSQTKEMIKGVMISQQLAQAFLKAEMDESRKEEQREILSAFVYLGELERQNAGDSYFAELARYYSNTNPAQRQILLKAHDEMQNGYALMPESKFLLALENFQRAKELFSSAQNVWEAQVAEYQICYCLCNSNQKEASNERLLVLSDFCETKKYKWLQSLADGWIGGNYAYLGEISKAIDYDRKSLQTARETQDVYNIQRGLIQQAEMYRALNNAEKAINYISDSTAYPVSYYTFPRQNLRNLFFMTRILSHFKLYEAASVYVREETNLAQSQDKWMTHWGLIYSAEIYGALQKYPEAFAQIESSRQFAETIQDEKMKPQLIARSLLSRAHLERQSGKCDAALDNYRQAIEIYEQMKLVTDKYEAQKGQILCYIAQEDNTAIQEKMPALLSFFDENRKKIVEEENRNTYFHNEQGVYDIAVDNAYTRLKESEQAFAYAESSRARSLLGLIENDSPGNEPVALSEVRRRIPPGAQMLYYAVLADKILIWRISDTQVTPTHVKIKSDELSDKVRNFEKLLTGRRPLETESKELYKILIQPVEAMLEPGKAICLVADKILFRVPFAALRSPQSGKFLIEDYALLYAPSATVFIRETELARLKAATAEPKDETILSVGNPAFSRPDNPGLRDLPAARREALKIAELYNSAKAPPKVYVEKDATKENFSGNLNEADVLHFAGHYVANDKSPALSKLLLAAGDLSVGEIMQRKLPRARLMILSACETGIENFYHGEGMIGAARAFLASDVPLVVASQWSVDSEASAELMIKFHSYRKLQKMTTVAALRQAQIDMATKQDAPFNWAGFMPIGGFADY